MKKLFTSIALAVAFVVGMTAVVVGFSSPASPDVLCAYHEDVPASRLAKTIDHVLGDQGCTSYTATETTPGFYLVEGWTVEQQ